MAVVTAVVMAEAMEAAVMVRRVEAKAAATVVAMAAVEKGRR